MAEMPEDRRARILAMKLEDRNMLAAIMRRELEKIPEEITRLEQQAQDLTAWLAAFAPEQDGPQ